MRVESRFYRFIKTHITTLCVIALCSLNTGCSNKSSDTPQTNKTAAQQEAVGFSFSEFTARKFTQDGQLSSVFSGSTLTHFSEQKRYQLTSPKGITQGSTVWEITADQADANEALDDIKWKSNVVLTAQSNTPTTLKTEQLNQLPNDGLLSGSKPVTFESNLGTIDATGFTLNTTTEALNLSGDVRGHYHNTQN